MCDELRQQLDLEKKLRHAAEEQITHQRNAEQSRATWIHDAKLTSPVPEFVNKQKHLTRSRTNSTYSCSSLPEKTEVLLHDVHVHKPDDGSRSSSVPRTRPGNPRLKTKREVTLRDFIKHAPW